MTPRKPDYRLSLARWMCGHDRSPENTVRRRKHRSDPWRETCLACERAQNAANYRARQPKRPQWINAMTPVQLAEARALYNRAMGLVEDSTDTAQGALAI